ncbi:MAG: nickel pincer cofactor biosynthesis protein LarC [Verrucomicrobia bacterium]|nr:nickel pincer cofactor biosynthesis protein LarC [Verrucomicrobiota bacterium]
MSPTHLHLDCPSGISGDMFAAALLDLGVPLSTFQEAVQALHLPEKITLRSERGVRGGIAGTRFLVESPHDHAHHHHHHGDHDHDHGRSWAQIRDLLQKSSLQPTVRDTALKIFHRVAEAEARIHGKLVDEVHFHEVGAIDSIVDIVVAAVGLHHLGLQEVTASVPVEGTGSIHCAHGHFPLPAPATAEILRGIPLRQIEVSAELTTPTGASILAQTVHHFGPIDSMVTDRIGYGLGTRELPQRPNVLRAFLGHTPSHGGASHDQVVEIRTHLDDITGEHLAHAIERLMTEGALDAAASPLVMKKGRPGQLLTVLALPKDAEHLASLVLRETTAFGLRLERVERRTLRREEKTVTTPFGPVRVKLGWEGEKLVQIHPEDADCRKLAHGAGVSHAAVASAARHLAH